MKVHGRDPREWEDVCGQCGRKRPCKHYRLLGVTVCDECRRGQRGLLLRGGRR